MNELTTFTNEQFGTVRTVVIDGEPWFVAADVCKALELPDTHKAVGRLDADEKGRNSIPTRGGMQEMTVVNEPGLYSLVLGCRKPEAKQFKRWITHEVIPSIRKNGGYIAEQDKLSETELMARALLVAQNVIENKDGELRVERAKNQALEEQIAELKPKARFAEALMASKSSIPVDALAKLVTQNGLTIGRDRLYWFLREAGYLIKSGRSRNLPTQSSMEQGWFEVEAQPYRNRNGEIEVNLVTRVTAKGQAYFIHMMCDE